MKLLAIILLICISSPFAACHAEKKKSLEVPRRDISNDTLNTATMKIKITVGDKMLTATLNDSPAAKDFASLLPLTVTLRDYNATEKISDLPRKLSTQDAPTGYDPSPGDITYYAPWGNLAIFYRDFGYSNGLIALGKIDGDVGVLSVTGDWKVSIELLQY